MADRPNIRSFSYRVTPHVPIRGVISTTTARSNTNSLSSGDQGSRGGGFGREERPGSTRIIWLIDEGSRVEPGDLVCELDSSAFEEELRAQRIRHAQAKSWVLRAETILEVAEIELREYRDGIYKQDIALVDQYLENCRTKEQEARETYDWSLDLHRKGLRSDAQLLGDRLVLEQWEIELENAREMRRRLTDYTGERILTSLEAKIEAVKADLLSQKAAFQVEDDRLKRLERAIANCKLYAPAEGIVVYARNTNTWGRVEDEIAEGVTVRENQAIIQLPDPENMQVQVKINESKINSVREGMRTTVRIDAFPDRPLPGRVKEIKPIPQPANIVSDVKLYSAVVTIEGGFEGIRPGLSAEVAFHLGDRLDVTRIPVQAIRWIDEVPYAALEGRDGSVSWRKLELGIRNPVYAEVRDGLRPGDRIVADPLILPAPDLNPRPVERLAARGSTER
ncbi:HlyD family efflux transporter periplasmic adaptor subunit [Tautonia sociabilis]|uniref:HlyD family efflux transporter periplasmic adaptor subunit n=1 Tax=Tautonia sociabilis TaxID=2080755 RepID=A0A432MD28_9BACT|nr:HlyD family efflux transporter periplasmic adaptor subunit [Tautonia sociabilis]